MVRFLILAGILLASNGCARRSQDIQLDKNMDKIIVVSNNYAYPIFSEQERLVDIPLLGTEPVYNITSNHDPRKLVLTYKIDLKVDDVIALYRVQMECFGWQEGEVVKGHHTCLVFKKPSKTCCILIKQSKTISKTSSTITLFIGPKK